VTGYGSYDWDLTPGKGREFSLHHHIQTSSGAHLVFYLLGTRGSFPRGEVTGA
jgi:hypothetical protein